jgi:26S proteasome non-ATPase regulatory subunit 10
MGGLLMALQAGADVNHKDDEDGWTPLLWAALKNKTEVAKVLLAHGAQVNVRNRGGRTAIYYARYKGHPEMEALLLQHGAE